MERIFNAVFAFFLLENRNGKNEYKFFVGNAIADGMIKSAYMDIRRRL